MVSDTLPLVLFPGTFPPGKDDPIDSYSSVILMTAMLLLLEAGAGPGHFKFKNIKLQDDSDARG